MNRLFAVIVVLLAAWTAPAQTPVRVLIITGGHPYEENAFTEMFRSMKGISFTHVKLGGEAEPKLKPENARDYDALVFYDMNQKCDAYLADLLSLLEQGKGTVFLHHALGSCADSDQYGYMVGGRARFGKPPGSSLNTSKFRANTSYRAHIEDRNIPITAGLSDFDVTDEVYSNYFFNTDSHVFLTTEHPLSGRQLAWTYEFKKSPVVYIQLGHDHVTYENPSYRRLVERSILWVAGRLATVPAASATPGEKLYVSLGCGVCHGNDARGARGPDLQSPVLWARADAQEHIADAIKNGVKGTEMPPYSKRASDLEIGELTAYLKRSTLGTGQSIAGDVRRGREIFNGAAACADCHQVAGHGGRLGPDLTAVAKSKGLDYLERAIREPSRDIPFAYATVSVVTKEGHRLTGVRRNEDTFSLQMVDRSGTLHMFLKDELKDVVHERRSLMPAYDESKLPHDALLDVLAYLQSPSDRP